MNAEDEDDLSGGLVTRRGDPETSREAGGLAMKKLTERQHKVYIVIHCAGRAGITPYEVETACGNHGSTYRTRIAELCGIGAKGVAVWPPLVRKTGRFKIIRGTRRELVVAICYDDGREP